MITPYLMQSNYVRMPHYLHYRYLSFDLIIKSFLRIITKCPSGDKEMKALMSNTNITIVVIYNPNQYDSES